MATYLCQKTRESSIEAIQRTIAQSKFRLTDAFTNRFIFMRAPFSMVVAAVAIAG